MKRLSILRVMIIAIASVCVCVFNVLDRAGISVRISYVKYPLIWLRHYLRGSGEDLIVPRKIVDDAYAAFIQTIAAHGGYEDPSYCLYSSTLYVGRGFYSRPVLFYLVGGFTFAMERVGDNKVVFKSVDRYDWHPTEDGAFFTSPLGHGIVCRVLCAVLGFMFGRKYFGNEDSVTGEYGISNRLWFDMLQVGAKEFDSIIESSAFREYDVWTDVTERCRELDRDDDEYEN